MLASSQRPNSVKIMKRERKSKGRKEKDEKKEGGSGGSGVKEEMDF